MDASDATPQATHYSPTSSSAPTDAGVRRRGAPLGSRRNAIVIAAALIAVVSGLAFSYALRLSAGRAVVLTALLILVGSLRALKVEEAVRRAEQALDETLGAHRQRDGGDPGRQ
jgi:hypothetical protein